MKQVTINKEKYLQVKNIMIEYGVSTSVFDLARKMNIDLVMLFYDKLVSNQNKNSKEQLSKNLLGIYGNLLATNYYSGLGYNVYNEFPIYMESGKEQMKADLYFRDNNGIDNYCEVKVAEQIIGNKNNYIDADDLNTVKNNRLLEIVKYKNIGKKLLKQTDRLKRDNAKVNAVFFNGCYVDDEILGKLKSKNINVVYLACNVKELESYVNKIVDDVDFSLNNSYTYDVRTL